jgi:hypothetical protein
MRETDQQTERIIQLAAPVHRLGLNRRFVCLLGNLMISATTPEITKVSKSTSSF